MRQEQADQYTFRSAQAFVAAGAVDADGLGDERTGEEEGRFFLQGCLGRPRDRLVTT